MTILPNKPSHILEIKLHTPGVSLLSGILQYKVWTVWTSR